MHHWALWGLLAIVVTAITLIGPLLTWASGWALFIGAILIVLFFKWLERSVDRDTEATLAYLAAVACPGCSVEYGVSTARVARQQFFDRAAEENAKNPGLRINVGYRWTVTCAHCGEKRGFHSQTWAIETV